MRLQRSGTTPVQPQQTQATTPSTSTARTPAAPAQANTARPADRFVSTSGGAVRTVAANPGRANAARNLPAEVKTGTKDYYKQRYDDFVRRNPGMTPPDYYLGYGQKYLDRFSSLGSKDLTPQGLEWRDKTLKALQDSIETKRMEDPVGFAQLERDPAAFKKFCYDSHPDAYVDSGLYKLPAQDLVKIGTTPDLRDLLNKDGINQVVVALGKMSPKDALKVAQATGKELWNDVTSKFKSLIPKLPW
jgi:hypothetical protein